MKLLETKPSESRASQSPALTCSLLGTGGAYASRVVPNRYFVETLQLDTTEEWIEQKTGIRERRHVNTESHTDLCIQAAQEALVRSRLAPDALDLIIVATSTSDYCMPSTACMVQRALGASNAAAFDLNAACAGFVHALQVASRWIAPSPQNALIIGADCGSQLTDPNDRLTAVFFGDAAGAAVLSSTGSGRILSSYLRSAGDDHSLLARAGEKLSMNGRQVWDFATRVLPETVHQLTAQANVSIDDIELIIPHQANLNILRAAAAELEISMDRVMVNLDRFGNTIAASIPVALDEALRDGRIQRGDIVALVGYGAGLTWGGQLWQI